MKTKLSLWTMMLLVVSLSCAVGSFCSAGTLPGETFGGGGPLSGRPIMIHLLGSEPDGTMYFFSHYVDEPTVNGDYEMTAVQIAGMNGQVLGVDLALAPNFDLIAILVDENGNLKIRSFDYARKEPTATLNMDLPGGAGVQGVGLCYDEVDSQLIYTTVVPGVGTVAQANPSLLSVRSIKLDGSAGTVSSIMRQVVCSASSGPPRRNTEASSRSINSRASSRKCIGAQFFDAHREQGTKAIRGCGVCRPMGGKVRGKAISPTSTSRQRQTVRACRTAWRPPSAGAATLS